MVRFPFPADLGAVMIVNLATRPRRNGFTLVELLVVIAIIGVLVGMLLPAVQQVREAARRITCANNLRQIGVAALNYESTHKKFPPGLNLPIGSNGIWKDSIVHKKTGDPPIPDRFGSWMVWILPFMEMDNLYDQLDLTQNQYANTVGPNSPGATKVITFLCPSDDIDRDQFIYKRSGVDHYFGLNSYLGNAGVKTWYYDVATFDGVFFYNSKNTFATISDGSSNTIAFGERFSNDQEYPKFADYRGWAWANFSAVRDCLGGTLEPVNYKLPPGSGPTPSYSLTDRKFSSFSSGHPGGANFAYCDGSVHFNTMTSTGSLSTLQDLAIINDGRIVEFQ